MERTTEEVLRHHSEALAAGDAAALMKDYAADAVVMTLEGANVGTAAIAAFFAKMQKAMPHARFSRTGICIKGEVVMTAWRADSDAGSIPNGVDTIVIRDGKIRLQTVWFSAAPQ